MAGTGAAGTLPREAEPPRRSAAEHGRGGISSLVSGLSSGDATREPDASDAQQNLPAEQGVQAIMGQALDAGVRFSPHCKCQTL